MLPTDFNEAKAVAESNMRDIADSMAGVFAKTQGIKAFLDKGIAGATDYEQTVTEFETLIGSAKETEDTLKGLTDFAVKTPFEMPQLLGVTRGLLQFGERGQEMMGTLKMLGDVSQGNAEKFGVLGTVFNQVRAEGKLTRENFMQLANRGAISLQDLSKGLLGTADKTKEVDKMMRTGKISFDDFRKVLEQTTMAGGKNHNAMERQSTTLGGLNSTLKDAIGITARMLATPLLPYLKAITTVQIKMTEGLASIITMMGPAASGMAVGAAAVSSLGLALTSASLAARFFGISIRSAIIGTGIGAVLVLLGGALGAIVMWIADAVGKTEGWSDTLAALSEAWGVLLDAAMTVAASIGEVWASLFGSDFTSSINVAAEYIAGLIKSVADWVISAKGEIIAAGEGVAFFFRNAGNLIMVSILDWVIFAMEQIPGLEAAYQGLAVMLVSVWAGMGGAFSAFISNFKGGLTEAANLGLAIWAGMKAGFDAFVSNLVGAVTEIKNIFSAVWASIAAMFNAFISNFLSNIQTIKNTAAAAWAAMKAGFEAAFDSKVSVGDAMKAAYEKAHAEADQPAEKQDVVQAGVDAFVNTLAGQEQTPAYIDPLTASLDATAKALADQKGADPYRSVTAEAKAAYDKAKAETEAGFESTGGAKAGLEQRRQELLDSIAADEEARNKPPELPPEEDKKEAGKPKDAAPEAGLKIDSGRYGFVAFGSKFQDAMLKKGGDKQGQMVDLLTHGNKTQDALLEEAKKKKGGLGE